MQLEIGSKILKVVVVGQFCQNKNSGRIGFLVGFHDRY